MFILIISAHQIFGTYELFLVFVGAHAVLMCIIHNVHLYKLQIGGKYISITHYVKTNFRSLDFYIENLINSVGCILIPNNIKYPRSEGKKVNQRYHEPTSFRYLAMHLIFFVENLVLVILCQLNITPSSKLQKVFADPGDNGFIRYYPYWTIGLFLLALLLKFLYYQSHAWPIRANCFSREFLCPFEVGQKSEECNKNNNDEQTEGKFEQITNRLFLKKYNSVSICIKYLKT